MDLVCTNCGEPWEMDYVLHEEPEAFERRNGVIEHCPSCPKHKVKKTPQEEDRLAIIRALGEISGDDIDGLCADLEDFGLL